MIPIAVLVVYSIFTDAAMLTAAGGWWMLLVFLVVPALVGINASWEPGLRAWRSWRELRRNR